jgi:hypothetical protein
LEEECIANLTTEQLQEQLWKLQTGIISVELKLIREEKFAAKAATSAVFQLREAKLSPGLFPRAKHCAR